MKIEGPGRTQNSDSSKGKGKVSSGDGSFGRMVSGESSPAGDTAATHSIARIDALLMVQAAEDPTERAARRRMQQRADNVLDELEKLRTAVLTGGLTVGHLIDIADVVSAHRERVMDPHLTAILDEIDLRAQVELAKLRMALDKRASG